jgi:23S rRNA pseudouridine1911/1915/1917 synthase
MTLRTIVSEAQHGSRLDRALTELLSSESRISLEKLISSGQVRLNGGTVTRPATRVEQGQVVEVDIPAPASPRAEAQDLPLNVVYQDEDVAVIDKPPGLVVHPAAGHADRTLVNALLFHLTDLSGIGGELRPGIVHRLDKDTSGLLLVAKNDAAHRALTAAWSTDAVRKEYLALVYGAPATGRGRIEAAIGRDPRNRKRMAVVPGGRPAVTDYRVVERHRYVSLLRCRLLTGRTHQIRVHLAHLGHPIVGDPVYSGPQWRGIPDTRIRRVLASLHRQALHAASLTFVHPTSGETMSFESPLPDDLADVLSSVR